ncbi:MAG: LCP family protein [Acidimicrobiia bacterium]
MAAPASPAEVGPHRSWPQRLLIVFNLTVIVAFLAGAGGLGYFYWRFDRIPRVQIGDGVLAAPEDQGEPQNFLLVGSDTRAFVEPGSDDEEGFGDESDSSGSGRSDTIIIVRVDPVTDQASMVSFPRDLWVDIPGKRTSGGKGRINTAFLGSRVLELDGPERNGAELLIETIKENFDIPIHHYAQVDFDGFRGLVDALGGVTIYLAAPVRDYDAAERRNQTGLDIRSTGCVELSGEQALAYVRSRHFQSFENGRWKSDQTGDFGRITRQQDFIRRAMNEAISKDLLNPIQLNKLVGVAEDNVKLSQSIDVDDLVKLARGFKSMSSDTLSQYQLPVVVSSHFGASTVDFDDEKVLEREAIFNVFRGVDLSGLDLSVKPSSVTLRVLNGSGVAGQAGDVSVALRALGFATVDTGNASRTTRSEIRYGPGQLEKAELLERYLVAGATLDSQPGLEGVDLLLVTGTDYDGLLDEPRVGASPTTTTTSSTTSTTVAGEQDEPAVPAC